MKPDLFNLLLVEWSVQKRGGTVLSRWRTNWAGEMDYASSSVRVKWFCVWVLKWASFYFNSFNFLTGFFYIYNCKHIFYAHVFIMKCSICVWIFFFFMQQNVLFKVCMYKNKEKRRRNDGEMILKFIFLSLTLMKEKYFYNPKTIPDGAPEISL